MTKNKKHKNKYNHYSEAFRREAVRRSDDPNTSAAEVARELGIHPGQIYNWRRQYKRLSEKQFNTVRGVDGRLLQIKNRSNSENSSSSAVRAGTQIEKWFRIKADRIEYMWGALNDICGTTHLSEDAFVTFVQTTIANNPACLAVEPNNPWI